MRFEKSNRTTKATISTRNFDDTFEFEIRHEIREVEFDDEFKVRFEKSNRAMKRKTRIRNSRNLNSTLESKISTTNSNRNSRNRIRRQIQIRHKNRDSRNRIEQRNEKFEFEIRHENFRISQTHNRKAKSFTTNDRRTTRSSLTRNALTLARNDSRTHTRDTHIK